MSNQFLCDAKSCTGCGSCAQACPKNCIKMQENAEGFLHPVTDESLCVKCGLCGKSCHILHMPEKHASKFYMCWNQNKEVLKKSSSGGVFTAVAQEIFNRGGVVFGAYQDFRERKVYHVQVNSFEELDKVRLSKYCQSDMKAVCKQIREFLNSEKPVFFCGTACQVAGVLQYIKNSSAKSKINLLYTADVLCHGVASQKTVNAFLKSKEKKAKKKIKKYYFRVKNKKYSWHSGCGRMRLVFEDNSEFVAELGNDTYFMGFNNNLFLRESCYRCRYCGTERISDFTIADYWGVPENSVPPEQLHFGVSVMTVNTEKANSLLPALQKTMQIQSISPETAVSHNRSFQKPNPRHSARDDYFRMIDTQDYDTVIEKLLPKPYFKGKIKQFVGMDSIRRLKKFLKRK